MKDTIRLESDLLEPVSGHLRSRGYRRQCCEVQFFEYRIDLYAYELVKDVAVAVELKLQRWKRAFQQALVYQLCADFVYLALPKPAAARVDPGLLTQHNLGLIGVDQTLQCVVLLPAQRSTVVMPSYRSFYVQLMREHGKELVRSDV